MNHPAESAPAWLLLSGEGQLLVAMPESDDLRPGLGLADLESFFPAADGGTPLAACLRAPAGECRNRVRVMSDGTRIPGHLVVNRWKEVPGGLRVLVTWLPEACRTPARPDVVARYAQSIRLLLDRARAVALDVQTGKADDHSQLLYLMLLVDRAHGLLGALSGDVSVSRPLDELDPEEIAY